MDHKGATKSFEHFLASNTGNRNRGEKHSVHLLSGEHLHKHLKPGNFTPYLKFQKQEKSTQLKQTNEQKTTQKQSQKLNISPYFCKRQLE